MIEARDDPAPGAHPGHATRLLAMADELLARAGVAWSALDRIAVGVGPGTFTGLRVGIATARGLAQSLAVDLVGVSSLLALAHAAAAGQGHRGVLSVIDARRGQVFAAAYALSGVGAVDELASARALAPEELGSVLAEAEQHDWDRGEPWLAVGDGAVRFREHLEPAGVAVPVESSPLHLVDARATCAIGALAEPEASLEQLLPDYRRRADAEIALEGIAAGER